MKTNIRPEWIRGRLSFNGSKDKVRDLLERLHLNSVCIEADCPNKGECWNNGQVTFLVMGDNCTRKCLFCNITKKEPVSLSSSEPERIARAVKELKIKYLVLTSVTRDDLPDQGLRQYSRTVEAVKKISPEVGVELLIPDLLAEPDLIKGMSELPVEVIGHNIEIPRRLYPAVRAGSDYDRSLNTLKLLDKARNDEKKYKVKSSVILGLGEKDEEIFETFRDLRTSGVDILYIGQYLRPSADHWPIKKYYTPDEFRFLKNKALETGFKTIYSAPMVRSSYRAQEAYEEACREPVSG